MRLLRSQPVLLAVALVFAAASIVYSAMARRACKAWFPGKESLCEDARTAEWQATRKLDKKFLPSTLKQQSRVFSTITPQRHN
jgi:hypothetical protein